MNNDKNNLSPELTKFHNEEQLPPIPTENDLLAKRQVNKTYWWMVAGLTLNLVGVFIGIFLFIFVLRIGTFAIALGLIVGFGVATILITILPFFLKGRSRSFFLFTSAFLGFAFAEPLGFIAMIILIVVASYGDF